MRTLKTYGIAVAVIALFSAVPPISASDPNENSPPLSTKSMAWEIKGIHLGITLEEVQVILPTLKCKPESFDAGLVTCFDMKSTLAGNDAVIMVKLLEGEVVLVSIRNINLEQLKASAVALTEKYGEATRVIQKVGQEVEALRQQRIYTNANYYAWIDGPISLQLIPFNSIDNETGVKYSTVILQNEAKHDRQWILRYKAKDKKASDI